MQLYPRDVIQNQLLAFSKIFILKVEVVSGGSGSNDVYGVSCFLFEFYLSFSITQLDISYWNLLELNPQLIQNDTVSHYIC